MANLGGILPLLLLTGGSSITTVLTIALLQNEGILNNLLGFGSDDTDSSDASAPVSATNIYDVASAEVAATGSMSTTTAAILQERSETEAQTSVAEAERDARVEEAEADAEAARAQQIAEENRHDENLRDAAIVGGLGGAAAGALLGAQIGVMGGPIGAFGGAGIGAILGAVGLVAATNDDDGDWWPFW